jgi:hypothetical protein
MKKSSPPPPGFGSPRRRGATSFACTPTKGSPLSRFEQASPKRKRYDRSGPTTKGSPSDDGSQACHSVIVHIEQNCRARKKSEIVGDTKDDQTQRSDIDETAATKRQKSNNKRGLKATRLASSEKYTVNGKPVETERLMAEEQSCTLSPPLPRLLAHSNERRPFGRSFRTSQMLSAHLQGSM